MGAPWISWLAKVGVIAISMTINIAGPQIIAYISGGLMVVMFIPFVAMCVQLGIDGKFINGPWTESMGFMPPFGDIQWGVLISTLVWALGGFDYVGALCGEVKGGHVNYFKGILISVPFSLCTYALPIMLCVIAAPVDVHTFKTNDWAAGGYTKIAQEVTPWLGYLMTAAACFAMVGQTVSGTAVVARQLQCTSNTITPSWVGCAYSRNGAPVVSIFISTGFIFALSAIPFNTLAQVFLLQRIISLFFGYIALIWLRAIEPKTERPFKTPFGIAGCISLLVPTAVLSFFVMYFMRDKLVWIISGAVELAILLAYAARFIFLKCTGSKIVICRTRRVKSTELLRSEEGDDAKGPPPIAGYPPTVQYHPPKVE